MPELHTLPNATDSDHEILAKIANNLGVTTRWSDKDQAKKATAARVVIEKIQSLEASKPTPIADAAAAYALTGVAVGTVYKTADTGQIMECRGRLATSSFVISGNGAGMMGVTIAGFYQNIADPIGAAPVSDAGYPSFYIANEDKTGTQLNNNQSVTYESGYWWIKGSTDAFKSTAGGEAHPADVVAWTLQSGASGTVDSVVVNDPHNWKHDGTILVYDNDEKQLLVDLPDTQQVEVVGEGGRIERFNGDNAGSNFPFTSGGSFYINGGTYDNGGTQDLTSGNQLVVCNTANSAQYFSTDSWSITLNGVSWYLMTDATNGNGTANKWALADDAFRGAAHFESLEDSDTVHPADATWVAMEQGLTVPTFTRAPEATESNWFAIKNTVYLTVSNDAYSGAFDFMGETIADGASVGIGWVSVSEALPTDAPITLATVDINGASESKSNPIHQHTGFAYLSDVYPRGALVRIGTPA